MKAAFGQKQVVSLLDLQFGAVDIQVFKHEGSTDGQGAFGGGDLLGGAGDEPGGARDEPGGA